MNEFRLYYDDNGRVICYNNDNSVLPYNYIVIDKDTYAESRHDIRVVDGKIKRQSDYIVISRLVESDTGITCCEENICILNDIGKKWKIEVTEYEN